MLDISLEKLILSEEKMLDKLEVKLKNKLNINPESENDLFNLAEILRKSGKLDDAKHYYKKTLEISQNNYKAQYLYNLLSLSKNESEYPDNYKPIPFVVYDNFLNEKELHILWSSVFNKKDSFKKSKTYKGQENSRLSYSIDEECLPEISEFLIPKLKKGFYDSSKFLNLQVWNENIIEFKIVYYPDGSYFNIHIDNSYYSETKINRYITFVYYFHREPKAFKGGELILFDTDKQNKLYTNKYTRIIPENNKVIFFPSRNNYHQVKQIRCDSTSFEHSRFTITGWTHL